MSDAKDRIPRLRKRRVVIRLEARNVNDAKSLLQSVEEVFRPSDVEIDVVDSSPGKPEEDVIRRMAIEPLETAANAEARKRLDEKEEAARSRSESASVDPEKLEAEVNQHRNWLGKARNYGWLVVRAVIEAVRIFG